MWPLLLILASRCLHRIAAVSCSSSRLSSFALNVFVVNDVSDGRVLPAHDPFLGADARQRARVPARVPSARRRRAARGGERRALARNAAACLGVVLLALALVLIRREHAFPGWWALLPTLGTALLIWRGPDCGDQPTPAVAPRPRVRRAHQLSAVSVALAAAHIRQDRRGRDTAGFRSNNGPARELPLGRT